MSDNMNAEELARQIDLGVDAEITYGQRKYWIGHNYPGDGYAASQTGPTLGETLTFPSGAAVLAGFMIDGVPIGEMLEDLDEIRTNF
ncbi:MAG: hypothetical protein LBK46_09490 [Oscillospiraceae bacterium]|jgi:hypothetical protein|nr:hypothetical protein [Oscillospiraceae bacterium]